MKKEFLYFRRFSLLVVMLMILTFALSFSAQKTIKATPSLAEDTSMNPHDFIDDYYFANGIDVKGIIGRRTGTDYLSVFSRSSNPIHSDVRVLATLPAYNQNGEIRFWYPLGELNDEGFTQDSIGAEARQIADFHPIYVFPSRYNTDPFAFTNNRQAAIIDESYGYLFSKGNPLGLRLIVSVKFTEKALNTKEGMEMMTFMAKKNGLSFDGTPLIKNTADLLELNKYEFISMEKFSFWDDPARGIYAMNPTIENLNKGGIAQDAFLLMAMQDGKPLADESEFAEQFSCLQKTGNWCGRK
jgi:hypothetical protein